MSDGADRYRNRRLRLEARWGHLELQLRRYSEHCTPTARIPYFRYREGQFVALRTALLMGMVCGALHVDALWARLALSVFPLFLLLDALAVNTSYIFISGSPVSPLRSVFLTMGTYFDLALCFAPFWAWVPGAKRCEWWERAADATYESFRTLSLMGPDRAPDLFGKLLIIAELLTGIYFVAVIIATYASWAKTKLS